MREVRWGVLVVVLLAAASPVAKPAPVREHPWEARWPLWRGELACADGKQTGLIWEAIICGRGISACNQTLTAERQQLLAIAGPETKFGNCDLTDAEDRQRVYCFDQGGATICSGQEMFCEELLERSTVPDKSKRRGCKRYRLF